MNNPFFINNGPFEINNLLKLSDINNMDTFLKKNVSDIKDLLNANENHLTFFHSKNYESLASKTKAAFCITKKKV